MSDTWLQTVTAAEGPFTSVHLDVTRTGPSDDEVRLRWEAVRRDLEAQGAGSRLLADVGHRLLEPTGRHGAAGRSVVAAGDEVLVDRVLPAPPAHDAGRHGLLPDLVPLARAVDDRLTYLVVSVDRRGADIEVVDSLEGPLENRDVDGGHDELRRTPGGGTNQRRYQARVEDSVERNADAVARELTRVVAAHSPDLVLVTGDPASRAAVKAHLGRDVLDRAVPLDGGGRADGVHDGPLADAVRVALDAHRQTRVGDTLARWAEADGRGSGAATGVGAVAEALAAGAVDVLLLHAESLAEQPLFAGRDPLHLGTSADAVRRLGAYDVVEDRADVVLVRALVAQGGHAEFVDLPEMLPRHAGAVLRFDLHPV